MTAATVPTPEFALEPSDGNIPPRVIEELRGAYANDSTDDLRDELSDLEKLIG